jgi:hypothetical protein
MGKFNRVASGSFGEWIGGKLQVSQERKAAKLTPFDTDVKPIVFKLTDIPKNIRSGDLMVQVSEDKKSIVNFRPYNAQVSVKFSKFPAREGTAPVPKSKKGRGGSEYLTFCPLLIVTKGAYEGIDIPYPLYYNFIEGKDKDGKSVVDLRGTGAGTDKVEEFLDVTGISDYAPLKWSDNLLPMFEKMAHKKDREFDVVLKKGWIVVVMGGSTNKPDMSDPEDFTPGEPDVEPD